jgi:putative spermidine/putrescine transport system ATP-binding protein
MSQEIKLEGLRKVYADATVALDDVSLVCPRAKTTSLVGPSGSGKSTILKIIAGLLDASGGRVLFGAREVTHLPPERRNIGMVFQSYALFPNMTVRENIEFPLLVRNMAGPERKRLAEQALETVQIAGLGHRRIHQLSGGQQQRVALARAIVFQPDILLLDEPLSALDAKIRVELRGELAALLRRFNITAVYVTHDQQEAMSLGDQVVVLDRGRIMQIGAPYEVYARPANAFVANFIGLANICEVDVRAADGADVAVRFAFGELAVPRDLFAERWPGVRPGRARLLCRPEDIAIATSERAHTQIRVMDTLFLGDRIRITGETANGQRLLLEAHNSTPVRVGESLPVSFDLRHVHFLSEGAG